MCGSELKGARELVEDFTTPRTTREQERAREDWRGTTKETTGTISEAGVGW